MTHTFVKCIFIAMFGITPFLARPEVPAPATYPRPSNDEMNPPAPRPPPIRETYSPYKLSPAKHEAVRNGWYIGFGFGGGSGTYTEDGATGRMRSWDNRMNRDFPVRYFNFKFGRAVSPRLLLGHDMTLLRSHSDTGCYSTELIVTNYNLVATFYPWKQGLFVRSGGGASMLLHKDQIPGQTMKTAFGANVLTGVGYAIPLGKSLTMSLNADYSMQHYGGGKGKPNASRVVAGWFGFDWY